MKKITWLMAFSLGFLVSAYGISEKEQVLRQFVDICVQATCPGKDSVCADFCVDKVSRADAHGETITMPFTDVMADCLDFTCSGGDAVCVTGKMDAFLQLRKGDPAPCYGGG